jgi:Flp pilus assembly protein TadD
LQVLGFSECRRHDLLMRVLDRVQRAPFTRQAYHSNDVALLQTEAAQCRLGSKPAQVQRAARQVAPLVALRPEDPDLRWEYAQLLTLAGESARAKQEWRAVIHLRPHEPLAYCNLGQLCQENGQFREAIWAYEQCLKMSPDYFEARYALGVALIDQGRAPEAIAHLRKAVRQKPQSTATHLALGHALERANRPNQARNEFGTVLRLDSANAQARNALGAGPRSR